MYVKLFYEATYYFNEKITIYVLYDRLAME